jgi:hypothetical protein
VSRFCVSDWSGLRLRSLLQRTVSDSPRYEMSAKESLQHMAFSSTRSAVFSRHVGRGDVMRSSRRRWRLLRAPPAETISRRRESHYRIGSWLYPPFPASCAFRSTMVAFVLPPHGPRRANFPQRVLQARLPAPAQEWVIRGRNNGYWGYWRRISANLSHVSVRRLSHVRQVLRTFR